MSKWIAEFELEDGDTMPEHMDLEYKGAKIDFHCKPLEQEQKAINEWCTDCKEYDHEKHCCPRFSQVIKNTVQEIHDNQWIPCSERLPEEKINPITQDFYMYQCTFKNKDVYDVRTYKFGKSHWWHGLSIMDNYVIAWRESPEPYKPKDGEEDATNH